MAPSQTPFATAQNIARAIEASRNRNPNTNANMFIINKEDTPPQTTQIDDYIPTQTNLGYNHKNADGEVKIQSFYEDPLNKTILGTDTAGKDIVDLTPKPEMEISVDKDGNAIYRSYYCNSDCLVENTQKLKEGYDVDTNCEPSLCFVHGNLGNPTPTSEHFTEYFNDGTMPSGKKKALKVMEWITIILSVALIILCIILFYKKNYKKN